MTGGKRTRQILLLNSICTNHSHQKYLQRRKTSGEYQIWKSPWLCSTWHLSTREYPRGVCQLSTHFQEHYCWKRWHWSVYEKICREEGLLTQPIRMIISTCFSEKRTIFTPLMLFHLELNWLAKKLSFCEIHSSEVHQQYCSICGEFYKRGRRESNI